MELEKLIVVNLSSKPVCDEMVDELYHEIARALNRNGEILINKVPANQVQTLARAILRMPAGPIPAAVFPSFHGGY